MCSGPCVERVYTGLCVGRDISIVVSLNGSHM